MTHIKTGKKGSQNFCFYISSVAKFKKDSIIISYALNKES